MGSGSWELVAMAVMRPRTTVVTSLVVAMFMFLCGCQRAYGPRFVNETETSAYIIMVTIETETSNEWDRIELPPGRTLISRTTPLQPGEIKSIKITYSEKRTITFDREHLEQKLPDIGGAKNAVFMIRSDGVQLISWRDYKRYRKRMSG